MFGTDPARDWLRLLEAIERPTSPPRAHAAALTAFLGWSAERVASADDEDWEAVHRRLHHWARVLRVRGVASLTETITLSEGLPARILARTDGERRLTDLRHVGQLLHAEAASEADGSHRARRRGCALRIAEADAETGDEERSRRLESDEEAVQVLTIHRSKGLEFPVVYHPDLWEPSFVDDKARPVFFHDPDAGDARTIDVGLDGPDYGRHQAQHETEQRGEDLRLAYVALTRAQHQAVVWWAGSWDSRNSALGRLLFAARRGRERAAEGTAPRRPTPRPSRASRRSPRRRPAASASSARRSASASQWTGEPRAGAELERRALRPRARLGLAAHLLQRHHRGGVRSPGGERARGGRRRRRAVRRRAGGRAGSRVAGRRGHGRADGDSVAPGRDARRRPGRHLRAPRVRDDRLRRGGPRRRARRAGGRGAGSARGRHRRRRGHGRRAAGGSRDPARPVAGRRPSAGRGARGPCWTSSTSSSRSPAATSRRPSSRSRPSARCSATTRRPAIRCTATPSGSAIRRCAGACAAT
ncbi:MAG: 3'-5' exonuclease [Thermoleophilaceae bacterium]